MSDVDNEGPTITVRPNGPYLVSGGLPVSRRRVVASELAEPLEWQTGERFEPKPMVALCRCGGSTSKPFCDGTHARVGFDGTEQAPTSTYDERARAYDRETKIVVRDDRSICEHAGFCGNHMTNVWKMVTPAVEDTIVRSQMMAMINRCPSGALTMRTLDGADIEPELGSAVGVIDDGPLLVTGRIAVTRADGEPFESRNRVTLCRCGHSASKPLCDGSHAHAGFTDH